MSNPKSITLNVNANFEYVVQLLDGETTDDAFAIADEELPVLSDILEDVVSVSPGTVKLTITPKK